MVTRTGAELKLRYLWLAIGFALVTLVVYLSLTSRPVDPGLDIPYQDKLFHALAYFTLMAWFSQIYHDGFRRIVIAVIFILMGVLLEYLQSFDANRYSEVADMAANVTGVLLGLAVTAGNAKNILFRVDKFLANQIL